MISENGIEMLVDEINKSTTLKQIDLGVLDGSIRKNSFSIEGAKAIASMIL